VPAQKLLVEILADDGAGDLDLAYLLALPHMGGESAPVVKGGTRSVIQKGRVTVPGADLRDRRRQGRRDPGRRREPRSAARDLRARPVAAGHEGPRGPLLFSRSQEV